MRKLLVMVAFAVGLFCLPPMLPPVATPPAFAYEFSATELQVEAQGRYQCEQSQQPAAATQAQAQPQSEEINRLHNQIPQFNPREHDSPAPFLYTPSNGARSQVCRQGVNGVYCQQ